MIENVIAGNGSDRITGNTLNNNLNGGNGNDQLFGVAGNDTLNGGVGNDALYGGEGIDLLTGMSGDDILTGGNGNDSFIYNSGKTFLTADIGVDFITDFTPGADKLVLSKNTFKAVTSIVGNGFSTASDFAIVQSDDLAATSSAFMVYSSSSGSIFYNQNGITAGFGTGAEFASIVDAPALTTADFVLQA